ncbi:hypothetical protein CDL12_03468 [Handroanthus impetiginosus]|uniref:Disease resistance R13L4/SHOC-2-like LRR domain-containing protein n=1 Tax=Handroanthus impetiginosus TaxID=429701 RepID=A0A2G9I229_9LAMI|nr:hypothetical protein CDL12_03468 [Handroanthus impetiginosus]
MKGFNAPHEIGRLLCLQKLCCIDAADGRGGQIKIVREIGKLIQLQSLGITKLRREDGKEFCSSLSNLANLRSLKISSFEKQGSIDLEYPLSPSTLRFLRRLLLYGRLERIPQWIGSLNALTTLILAWSGLREDSLEYIQGLPNLLELSLDCAYEGQELNFKAGCFQRLHHLALWRLRELRWVTVEKGSMPLLHTMIVRGCKSMGEMPDGIEYLKNLTCVRFIDMAKEFVERLRDERRKEGDHWRLADVTQVMVYNWVNNERNTIEL